MARMGKMYVDLPMMLQRREERAFLQKNLLSLHSFPLISFTMNIAGPEKNSFPVLLGFLLGLERIKGELYRKGLEIKFSKVDNLVTGPEAFLVVDGKPESLKAMAAAIEEEDALGRLFDIDVFAPNGEKLERERERRCLLCQERAKICASRRTHGLEALQERTQRILKDAVLTQYGERVASLAVKALLHEVAVTPKPGLVDRMNNGSHRDLDFFLFLGSASSLHSYFREAFALGYEGSASCASELLSRGSQAERSMYLETEGRNTHKGAVYTLGLAVAAFGLAKSFDPKTILESAACLAKEVEASRPIGDNPTMTFGEELKRKGIGGARDEAFSGFPAVLDHGLPALEECLEKQMDWNRSGLIALLSILLHASDTNMMKRGGVEGLEYGRHKVEELLGKKDPEEEDFVSLDKAFQEKGLSPGGSADLLALCFFLHFLKEESLG